MIGLCFVDDRLLGEGKVVEEFLEYLVKTSRSFLGLASRL